MDYEIVSYNFDRFPFMYGILKDLVPYGFGIFGHGHKHDDHDQFGYEYSLNSFTQNYESMMAHGILPVSYAYPHGGGRLPETQQALSEAGFLSGRLFEPIFEGYGPYIMPGDETEPPNWLALPSLRMEDIDFEGASEHVNNPAEFKEHLDNSIELGSWIITTYHGIGWDGETDGRPRDWGFYKRDNFFEEMLYVKQKREEGKVWLATMDDVTLYTMQRNKAEWNLNKVDTKTFELFFDDSLDNELYRMPLTLELLLDSELVDKNMLVIAPDEEVLYEKTVESERVFLNLHPSGVYYRIVFN